MTDWDTPPVAPPALARDEEEAAAALLRREDDYELPRPKRLQQPPARDAVPSSEHRLLPASVDAEQGVLSSFLIDPKGVGELCSRRGTDPVDFHTPSFGLAFGVMLEMHGRGKPIDLVLLTEELHKRRILEECGGAAKISELFMFPTAANAEYYLDILEEKRALRSVVKVGTEFSSRAYVEQDNAEGLLDEMEKAVLAIRRAANTQRGFTGRDVAVVGMDRIIKKFENMGRISGLSTGFPAIDKLTDGLHGGDLIVLAARPSEGKSALAMNIAEYQAIEARNAVGILSLEMGKDQLSERLIASYARVNTSRWRHGEKPDAEDMEYLKVAADWYATSPFYFEEMSDPKIQDVRGIGRRMVRDHEAKLLIVDSLSVLRSPSKQGRENRAREVAECSNGLKEMAKELNVPVIAIAHLDRGLDRHKEPERPRLSDLRESGNIEQDADSVWMLWRKGDGSTELFCPKQRNGERFGSCPLRFLPEFARFEYAPQEQHEAHQQELGV